MALSAEALYMAKRAYDAYKDILDNAEGSTLRAFQALSDQEKQAWEAAADAVRHLVMRALVASTREAPHAS